MTVGLVERNGVNETVGFASGRREVVFVSTGPR